MEIAGNILSMCLIAVMCWQDFKTRTISAWILPTIGICFLCGELSVLSTELIFRNAGINYALLILQFSLLWLWISARNKKWVNIIDTQIGLGDILLLLCLAPAFSPFNFFLFYTLGSIFAVLVHLIINLYQNTNQERIPLAGILGLPLIALCAVRLTNPSVLEITEDLWIINIVSSQ